MSLVLKGRPFPLSDAEVNVLAAEGVFLGGGVGGRTTAICRVDVCWHAVRQRRVMESSIMVQSHCPITHGETGGDGESGSERYLSRVA